MGDVFWKKIKISFWTPSYPQFSVKLPQIGFFWQKMFFFVEIFIKTFNYWPSSTKCEFFKFWFCATLQVSSMCFGKKIKISFWTPSYLHFSVKLPQKGFFWQKMFFFVEIFIKKSIIDLLQQSVNFSNFGSVRLCRC